MMNLVCFYLVIFLSNIIHGITGFAGTILAMPFGLMLVGYATAKPVLNVLGLLSGIYVFVGFHDSVNWKELKKIVVVMAAGMEAFLFGECWLVGNRCFTGFLVYLLYYYQSRDWQNSCRYLAVRSSRRMS